LEFLGCLIVMEYDGIGVRSARANPSNDISEERTGGQIENGDEI
jgi:hypothetical protein